MNIRIVRHIKVSLNGRFEAFLDLADAALHLRLQVVAIIRVAVVTFPDDLEHLDVEREHVFVGYRAVALVAVVLVR